MFIISCEVKLRIPMAHSLKDKRRVIKSIIERCKNQFNIAIAEVDQNELWQSSVLAFVSVSNKQVYLEQLVNKVIKYIEGNSEVYLVEYNQQWL